MVVVRQEIWVLGAAGRIGRAVARDLGRRGHAVVLVGLDRAVLEAVAADVGGPARAEKVNGPLPELVAAISRARPAVVVNAMGGYARNAAEIARAAMGYGGHYADLATDLEVVPRMLALSNAAAAAGSTVVTGSGFGVLGTEAVAAMLCRNRPVPDAVRVDALPSVATAGGRMGTAFAESMVDVLVSGGRRYSGGRLVRERLGAEVVRHVTPDGTTVASASAPSGELIAAHAASGAAEVRFSSALVPTSAVVRAVAPLAGRLLSIAALRRFAVRRMAAAELPVVPRPRPHSWGRAVVTWADGTSRTGWLRADDAMDFTSAVLAEVADRLIAGGAPAGAFTPAAAFGPDVAVAAGATFVLDQP